jgi:hypothetical protein
VTEAVMQALAAEVTGAVNAATLPPSLAAPLLAAAEDVRIALKVRSSEARLENLKTSVANLHPEVIATRVMVDSGALGRRRYAPSQPLTVRHAGKWSDVHASDAPCELQPWNHAPRELSEADFDVLAFWHAQALRNQHATIFDPFLGRTLDTLEECMRIEVTGRDPEGHHISISDASSLSDWLHGLHMSAVEGSTTEAPLCALLTAPPAAGKSCLLNQLIMHVLSHGGDFIPILVNVERLQQQLKLNEDIFYQAWNWVDAYLNLEWRDAVPYYLMLRQVGKALLPDQTALPPFPTGSLPRSDSPPSLS